MRSRSVNFVCLWIDTPGGSPTESIRLANFLADMDGSQVRTVAYVAGEARADAALVALACDHVVMHERAVLGGPGAYQPSVEEIDLIAESIRHLARAKSRPWSLICAMMDPDLLVRRYAMRGTTVVEYFSEQELAEQPDPTRWVEGEEVTTAGKAFSAEGSRAEALGLAGDTVANYDEFNSGLIYGAVLIAGEALVLTGVGLVFATFLSDTICGLGVFAVFFLGHSLYMLPRMAENVATKAIYYIFPSLWNLDLKTEVAVNISFPSAYVWWGIAYAAAYAMAMTGLATILFSRKDVS